MCATAPRRRGMARCGHHLHRRPLQPLWVNHRGFALGIFNLTSPLESRHICLLSRLLPWFARGSPVGEVVSSRRALRIQPKDFARGCSTALTTAALISNPPPEHRKQTEINQNNFLSRFLSLGLPEMGSSWELREGARERGAAEVCLCSPLLGSPA